VDGGMLIATPGSDRRITDPWGVSNFFDLGG
jgi:hypothetical protein